MQGPESACEVSAKIGMSLSVGRFVRVCRGTLLGISGTLAELPRTGRASIRLQQDLSLEIDQSCLELENAE